MEENIYQFVDSYLMAVESKNEPEIEKLEAYGASQTATYTDVAQAITTLTQGVSAHIQEIENNNTLNLNILIDALYQTGMITDEVLDNIEETLKNIKEKDEE